MARIEEAEPELAVLLAPFVHPLTLDVSLEPPAGQFHSSRPGLSPKVDRVRSRPSCRGQVEPVLT